MSTPAAGPAFRDRAVNRTAEYLNIRRKKSESRSREPSMEAATVR